MSTQNTHISGAESLLNQVGLFYCKESISLAKIKILWNILKMRWGCSPIVPPLPPPMTHIHSCINHCFCIHCIPFKFQYTKYKKFNKPISFFTILSNVTLRLFCSRYRWRCNTELCKIFKTEGLRGTQLTSSIIHAVPYDSLCSSKV